MENNEIKKLKLIREFRNQLVIFLDELIEQFPKESDLILIRIFIKDQIPMHDVLGRYIKDILPYKHEVDNRNESFFINHSLLYTGVGKDKVNHFKKLWLSESLDDNDREVIWKWMDVLNLIADNYKNNFGNI